jgi:hypothetical protein
MTTTTLSAALVPAAPVFTNTERGDVNPKWRHGDGGRWPRLWRRGEASLAGREGQPQKMQVGSRSISVRRSSTLRDGASRS